MRRTLTLALTLGTALTIAMAAIPTATTYARFCTFQVTSGEEEASCPEFPSLKFKFDGGITPHKLPKHEYAPAALNLSAKIATTDGTHPSALRELVVDLDRNITIDARGLPACHPTIQIHHLPGGLREACRTSIVGHGKADFELAFPEQPPIPAPSKLTVYNAGVHRSITTLYAAAQIDVPVPQEIITRIQINKIHKGRYGFRAIATVPKITGGAGSLLGLDFKLKRLFTYKHARHSLLMAKCPNGHLYANIESAIFKNEANTPGAASTTKLKGTLIRPCTPKS